MNFFYYESKFNKNFFLVGDGGGGGRKLPEEPSCEIISKSVHQFSRRSRLKLFFYL